VRLQLHALAYNMAHFLCTLALPDEIERWSLTTLQEKVVKISAKGTDNLIGFGRDKAHEDRVYQRLYPSGHYPSGHAGDLGPGLEGLASGSSILGGGAVIAAEVEEVVDLVVSGEEALGLTG
jgi:hypothetical protein